MYRKLILRFSKFASVGVVCATFSLSSNFVLLHFFDTPLTLTYVGVSVCSIALSFYLNSKYTFASKRTLKKLFAYYGVYLSSMLLGIVCLNIYDFLLDFPKAVYPFMVIPITMLWNFFYVSKIMGKTQASI